MKPAEVVDSFEAINPDTDERFMIRVMQPFVEYSTAEDPHLRQYKKAPLKYLETADGDTVKLVSSGEYIIYRGVEEIWAYSKAENAV